MPDERERTGNRELIVALVKELAEEVGKDKPASPEVDALLVRLEDAIDRPEPEA